jgi:Ca2+-binding EF-hand superfamily protein
MIKARELNLPFESGLVEFDKLRMKLGFSYEDVEKMLLTFTEYARKKEGKMSLEEFSEYLGLPPNESVKQIFELYDRVSELIVINYKQLKTFLLIILNIIFKNQDGKIEFREFVIGLILLSKDNSEETLKLAFRVKLLKFWFLKRIIQFNPFFKFQAI